MATKKKIIDYNEIFYDKNNGLPDEITKAGCIALAKLGKDAWNSWSKNHPVRYEDTNQGTIAKNTVDFSDFDFSKYFEESESKTIIHIDFKGFDFRERANFSNAIFCIRTDFSNSTFGEGTNFTGAVFKENVYFNDTNFGLNSRFIGCKFYGKSRFIGARFDRNSSFRNSSFSKNASFIGAQFGNSADFRDTIFFSFTNFSGGQFGTDIKFDDSIFKGSANFTASDWPLILPYYKDIEDAKNWSCEHGATPDNFRDISFNGVEFLNHVNFSDRIFIGKTSFSYLTNDNVLDKPCVFRKAPLFFNCKLNQNISFYGAIFPESTSGKKNDDTAIRAYRTLKLAFSQQQALREEQMFFRLELSEEEFRALPKQKLLFYLYRTISDYGFSFKRPLLLMLFSLIVFLTFYIILYPAPPCFLWEVSCKINYKLIQFSFLQSVPIPGFDKWSDSLREILFPKEGWQSLLLPILVMLHKGISLLAVFLIGLALRNLFKMK